MARKVFCEMDQVEADGLDFAQVIAAQRRAAAIANGQPTAVVYRTV